MTPITVLCPKLSCRAILRVPDTSRGQRVRCSSCQTAFLVPQKKTGGKGTGAVLTPKPQS
jgi:LSD1 subclass zinc finger protein